jgi:hypothetical protein
MITPTEHERSEAERPGYRVPRAHARGHHGRPRAGEELGAREGLSAPTD